MKRSAWIGAGVIGALAGLIVQLPLSWVGGAVPKSAFPNPLTFTGTTWNGQVSGLPLSGPLAIQTRPSQLLSGVPVTFESQSPGITLRGEAGSKQLKNLSYRAEFSRLPITDGRLVGLAGMIDVIVNDAGFGDGCETLTGNIRTDVLTRNQARLRWAGPEVSGPLTCEKGEILATLSGRDARTDINAIVHINMDGNYRLEATVISQDPEAGALLPLYGFQASGNQYSLTEQGQW